MSSSLLSVVYYPFGLTFNAYSRENVVEKKIKFQGQEHIDDLGLNWDSYRYRNHMPDIGRFFNIDPMASAFYYNSPYAFSENKVTTHREMEGLEAFFIHGTRSDNSMWKKDVADFIMRELKPYFTMDQTIDTGFKWNGVSAQPTPPQLLLGGGKMNWLGNTGKRDRAAAARMLVAYIMKHRVNGQLITLVGHSHGGNVAIQAARILSKKHGISVNIVNVNTPAWNGPNDPENPLNDSDINELLHFFTDGDAVAGPVAGDDYYHVSPMPNNIKQTLLLNPLKKSDSGIEHKLENINWLEVMLRFRASNQETSNSGNKKNKRVMPTKRHVSAQGGVNL